MRAISALTVNRPKPLSRTVLRQCSIAARNSRSPFTEATKVGHATAAPNRRYRAGGDKEAGFPVARPAERSPWYAGVVLAALLVVSLAAPGVQWSEKHGVGIRLPRTWKVADRDQGDVAFLVKGPRLGKGVPRLVVRRAGPASAPLDTVADGLLKPVLKRPGWKKTARQRKAVGENGAFPCVRFGLSFRAGDERGRARFTVALLGDAYWVLELSAHASHFPGATYDRIERSLAVRWRDVEVGGLHARAPPGWTVHDSGPMPVLLGPALGGKRRPVVILSATPLVEPPGAKAGEKWTWLGAERVARTARREEEDIHLVAAERGSAGLTVPRGIAKDVVPTMRAILKRVELRRDPPEEDR